MCGRARERDRWNNNKKNDDDDDDDDDDNDDDDDDDNDVDDIVVGCKGKEGARNSNTTVSS